VTTISKWQTRLAFEIMAYVPMFLLGSTRPAEVTYGEIVLICFRYVPVRVSMVTQPTRLGHCIPQSLQTNAAAMPCYRPRVWGHPSQFSHDH
jgi:hypothetical protein